MFGNSENRLIRKTVVNVCLNISIRGINISLIRLDKEVINVNDNKTFTPELKIEGLFSDLEMAA